jgi:hypothetical protein
VIFAFFNNTADKFEWSTDDFRIYKIIKGLSELFLNQTIWAVRKIHKVWKDAIKNETMRVFGTHKISIEPFIQKIDKAPIKLSASYKKDD